MENIIFTQLRVSEIRSLLREELESYFKTQKDRVRNNPPQTEKLLTVQEAAAYLSLSVATIYSKVSRNELPFMKRGKRVYFTQMELLDYLKDGRNKSNEEIEEEAINHLTKKSS
jgi:excisionase family DNA binding protein